MWNFFNPCSWTLPSYFHVLLQTVYNFFCPKDHLCIKTTWLYWPHYATPQVYKNTCIYVPCYETYILYYLCTRTTFGWSLYPFVCKFKSQGYWFFRFGDTTVTTLTWWWPVAVMIFWLSGMKAASVTHTGDRRFNQSLRTWERQEQICWAVQCCIQVSALIPNVWFMFVLVIPRHFVWVTAYGYGYARSCYTFIIYGMIQSFVIHLFQQLQDKVTYLCNYSVT